MQKSDFTVTDEKGNELGDCKNPDVIKRKLFTYVNQPTDRQSCKYKACCEANTARYPNKCINYSLCKTGKLKIQIFVKKLL